MTPEALEQELDQLHPAAFGWALACCSGDRAAAEDALQASYLKVLDGRASDGRPDAVTELVRADGTRRLTEALATLPRRQREVLHLVFYQDLTIAEAALVAGVSLGTARTHYERGKAALRKLLKEKPE